MPELLEEHKKKLGNPCTGNAMNWDSEKPRIVFRGIEEAPVVEPGFWGKIDDRRAADRASLFRKALESPAAGMRGYPLRHPRRQAGDEVFRGRTEGISVRFAWQDARCLLEA